MARKAALTIAIEARRSEARSHERLELLAHACERVDPELAAFEHDLVAAEARHAPLYVELAALLLPANAVAARHRALLAHEADVLRALPFAPRLHSGVPDDAAAKAAGG